jgi:hypothetical protein
MKRPKVIQKVAIWPFFERTIGHEIMDVVRQITEMVGHITGVVSEITEMVGHITEGARAMRETACHIRESTAIWKIAITLSRESFSVNQQLISATNDCPLRTLKSGQFKDRGDEIEGMLKSDTI